MPERELTLRIVIDASESAQTSAREAQQLKSVVNDLQDAIAKLSGSQSGSAAGAAMGKAAESTKQATEEVESLASASEKLASSIADSGEKVKATTGEASEYLTSMKTATIEIVDTIENQITSGSLAEYFRLAGLDAEKAAEKVRELRNEIKAATNTDQLVNAASGIPGLSGEVAEYYQKLFPHLGALEQLQEMEQEMQSRLQDSNFLKYINRVGISSEEAADRVEHFQKMVKEMKSLDDIAGATEQGKLVLGTLDRAAMQGSDQWLHARSQAYMKLGTSIKETTTAITQFARAWVLANAANKETAEEMLRTIAKFEAGAQLLGGISSLGANIGQLGGAIGGARAAMRGASPAGIRAAATAGEATALGAVGKYALPIAAIGAAGLSIYSGIQAASHNELGTFESVYRLLAKSGGASRLGLNTSLPGAGMLLSPAIQQARINMLAEQRYEAEQRRAAMMRQYSGQVLGMSAPVADLVAMMGVGPARPDDLNAQYVLAGNRIETAQRFKDSDLVRNLGPDQQYQIQLQQNQRILQLIQQRGQIEMNIHQQAIANKQKEIQALREEQQEISATVSMKARALVGIASLDPLQRSEALGSIERARKGSGDLSDYRTALQFATSDDERKALERKMQDQAITELGADASRLLDVDQFRADREKLDQINAKIDHEVNVVVEMKDESEKIADEIAKKIYDEMKPVVEEMQSRFQAEVERLKRMNKSAFRGAAPNTIDFIGSR